ncbi:preprotein translocase subunit SecG [methanotrophic endosymbiont of Bathymodiolus puteoserpentis (Logatchev)]|jgi:preprotein translocase subunit SecG|uniref:preprotein translocase subunit SecG n=1 Tax=methanotrophic endosymbiont of Bathymodiolus puteoserpentis (Logatchev) TaxID=343235 RepID=UPI00157BB243|nr:preprotein translocase subunit SecG [methanotrophic endosymbiont of Bathymodiolus puteoserpentis (Logatchev)]
MYQIIIIGHMVVGLAVIGLVLIQHGKGADAGAAFGSGSSGTVFGAQGSASFLSRTTGVLATVFFSTSLALAVLSGNTGNDADIMDTPVIDPIAAEVPMIESEQQVVNEPALTEDELPVIVDEPIIPK